MPGPGQLDPVHGQSDGGAKNTISKRLLNLVAACGRFQNATLVNLTTKRVKADEVWSFIGMKEK